MISRSQTFWKHARENCHGPSAERLAEAYRGMTGEHWRWLSAIFGALSGYRNSARMYEG